jgi:hypothetical protein
MLRSGIIVDIGIRGLISGTPFEGFVIIMPFP